MRGKKTKTILPLLLSDSAIGVYQQLKEEKSDVHK